MISIIIPIFNQEDNIHFCLNSLINQTYENFEVICINDASTDNTSKILDYFSKKDKRIKIYENKTKKGKAYCKNKGLKISKGEKIIFLNSDEWLSFNTLNLLSQVPEHTIENDLSDNISKFKKEISYLKNKIKLNNYITTITNEKRQLQITNLGKSKIINKIINNNYSDLTIAIKSPHSESTIHLDELFLSTTIKKSFEKLGFNVIIQGREHWYDEKDIDIALVLRGELDYTPDYSNINILWNISQPKSVSLEEYEKYDYVFISSKKYTNKIKSKVNTNVHTLLQCTDPDIFFPEKDNALTEDLLIVGATSGIYREILNNVLKTNPHISINILGWEKYIDEKYNKDNFIPNEELHKYYSSCKILIINHFGDMHYEDFPSNKIFDALSCGTFVISDNLPSVDNLFEGGIITYDTVDDLNNKINYYLTHEDERIKLAKKGQKIVLENHTVDNRIIEIISILKENKPINL